MTRQHILSSKTKVFELLMIILIIGINIEAQTTNSGSPLTFDEALQITLTNSEVVKQATFHNRQLEEEIKSVRNLRLPQISLNANYIMLSDDITIDMHEIRDAITPLYGALSRYGVFNGVPNPDPATNGMMPYLPQEISTPLVREQLAAGLQKIENSNWDKLIQKGQFGTLSAGVQWPLFTGGKINAANRAANIRLKEANFSERQKNAALYTQLVERYFGLALAIQAEMVREEVLFAMEAHLKDAEKLFNEGLIARAELLHAQLHHAQADRELRKARRERSIVSEALTNTMAVEAQGDIQPITALFYKKEIESVDFFKISAMNANPILAQVETKKELAGQGTRAERSALLPMVAAFGNYNIANIDLSPNISDYMVGLTLSWKLFGGQSARHKVKSALFLEAQVNEAHLKASRDIETGIEKYYQEVLMALEQMEELETAWDFANEHYRIRKQAFNEGLSTSTEVVDASLALAKVRIERLQTIYQYDVALARLLELAGISDQFLSYRVGAITYHETNNIQ